MLLDTRSHAARGADSPVHLAFMWSFISTSAHQASSSDENCLGIIEQSTIFCRVANAILMTVKRTP